MADDKEKKHVNESVDILQSMSAKINSMINVLMPHSLEDASAKTKQTLEDAYTNSVLGIGKADAVESFTNYGFGNDTLNWTLWLALYNDSWVFRRAIDKPAQDIAGHGIELTGTSDKTSIYERLDSLEFDLTQMVMWGSLFGGSVGVMLFNKVKLEYMYQSINKAFDDGLINEDSTLKLYVTDRWYGLAPSTDKIVVNLKSRHFGKPEYYDVTFADGRTFKIHHSWVIRYEHRVAPNLVKKGMLQGWGYAEGAHILNELSRDDKLKSSIHSLINKSLIEIIKMAGMRGVFMGADQDNEEQLKKRLEMVNWGRHFNSLTFLDKDDDYQMNTFPGLSGLSDLLEKNMWLVAAALDMQGILFGDLKGGFSNDSEAMVRYDETIRLRKNSYYREPLTQLLEVLYKMYNIKEPIKFKFKSLIVKKEENKLDDINKFGSFLSTMISDGVMTPQNAAIAIKKYSEQSGIDLGITQSDIDKLKDTVAEEMENIDLDENLDEPDDEDYENDKPKNKNGPFSLFKKKQKSEDAFVGDMSHVAWIENKYKKEYPALRVAWYDVDPKKQAKSKIQLTPSLYIFSDNNPVGRNSRAFMSSVRFSNHNTYFNCKADIRLSKYDKTKYEQEANRFIANNSELMKELYGH